MWIVLSACFWRIYFALCTISVIKLLRNFQGFNMSANDNFSLKYMHWYIFFIYFYNPHSKHSVVTWGWAAYELFNGYTLRLDTSNLLNLWTWIILEPKNLMIMSNKMKWWINACLMTAKRRLFSGWSLSWFAFSLYFLASLCYVRTWVSLVINLVTFAFIRIQI